MISALDSAGLSSPGSSPGQGHCVVFLAKKLYSHNASHHLPNLVLGVTLQWTSIPSWGAGEDRNTPILLMREKPR